MARRFDKARKSAILEHLLDLERQIRTELTRAGREREALAGASDIAPAGEEILERGKRATPTQINQRYLH